MPRPHIRIIKKRKIMSAEFISSRNNRLAVRIHSLGQKKYRDAERLFRADGIKLFREAVACRVQLYAVLLRESGSDRFLPEAGSAGCPVYLLADGVFDKISEEKSPEGIISVIKYLDSLHKSAKIKKEAASLIGPGDSVLALESVRDPGNFGTVVRSAAAFGVDTLLVSSDCADQYGPRAVRAAMGALFSRRIIRTDDLPGTLSLLRESGRRVFSAALDKNAVSLQDMTPLPGDVFVIGNEGRGLSPEVISVSDSCVFIPMETGPGIESLNAATAASVIMYEKKRC